MLNFLVLVVLQMLFQAFEFIFSAIQKHFSQESDWKDCPYDIDYWHSIHAVVTLVNLVWILLVLSRINIPLISPKLLFAVSLIFQITSLYLLGLGLIWIVSDIRESSCVNYI